MSMGWQKGRAERLSERVPLDAGGTWSQNQTYCARNAALRSISAVSACVAPRISFRSWCGLAVVPLAVVPLGVLALPESAAPPPPPPSAAAAAAENSCQLLD